MLEVSQLTRRYDHFVAADNVSFTINNGEIVGLLGHNGAGKTTIMKVISGYLEPNSGSVTVDGVLLEDNPNSVQKILGYLPENLPVYPELIVADYLDYAADLKGLDGQTKTNEIKRVVEATDISSKLLSPISTLSRGFKQRVGVAQAILGKPKLLILDEPTNGLDPEQTQHMRDLIREIAKSATVILSTHIMQEVEALCTRVLMLRSGQLALDEKLDAIKQSNRLLIDTTLLPKNLNIIEQLDGISHIDKISEEHNTMSYRINLTNKAKMKPVSANIANALISAGEELYQLQPELRDLETLFKDINEHKMSAAEVSHAA